MERDRLPEVELASADLTGKAQLFPEGGRFGDMSMDSKQTKLQPPGTFPTSDLEYAPVNVCMTNICTNSSMEQLILNPAAAGFIGPFQQLLNSFVPRVNIGNSVALQGVQVQPDDSNAACMHIEKNEEPVVVFPSSQTVDQEKPQNYEHYSDIDESGYFSEASSIYEVASDDEYYNEFSAKSNDDGLDSIIMPAVDLGNIDQTNDLGSNDFCAGKGVQTSNPSNGGINTSSQDTSAAILIEDEENAAQQPSNLGKNTPLEDTSAAILLEDETNAADQCDSNNKGPESDRGNRYCSEADKEFGKEGETEYCECINGNPFLHVMTQVNEGEGEQTSWKKRNTTKKGQTRADCRVPKGMGPIEIAMRNAPYRKTKYIFEPIIGITFDSENEAFEFYNMYSWEVGFGIKKATRATNNKGFHTKRDLRCLCSGIEERAQYKTKKTNCQAMIRLLRSNDDGWYISKHVAEHNHPLTVTCGQKQEWYSHANLDQYAKDMIKYLRENKVSLTKVHCIMGSMFGSMNEIPITKRSIRAICAQIARDQMDDDVQKTLNIFRQIRSDDPGFQFSVELDDDNKIRTLMWINGKSRHQYEHFGDVLSFDTTYCTNIYKMPFGLFVGVNNHFQTTIFGGVFMKEETTRSFEWVFSEFLSLMGGKPPLTVFTDQCAAMAAALKNVWKGVTHLLCKWHMFKDASAKLGPIYKKGSPFRKLFHKIINDMLTIDEFERAWNYMINMYKLSDNQYLQNIYNKREKWAKPFFKDCFCARMSSTQRSESANHMLKRFVPRNCSMNRFIVQFNKLLFERNKAEDTAEFDTTMYNSKRERSWPIEDHAASFYTASVHGLLRKEINRSTHYFAKEVGLKEYHVIHVKPDKKLPWGRDKFIVKFNADSGGYDCECGLYQHSGMLCSHVLRVLVQVGAYEIPKAHIHKRWTRLAREILPEGLKGYQRDTLCIQSMTYRHSYLYVRALDMVNDGNKDLGAFEIVAKSINKTKKKLREYFNLKEKSGFKGCEKIPVPVGNYCTTDSEAPQDSGSEFERGNCNTYGAAGSCAGMSDSELLKIKAPSFIRSSGRPKELRFKGITDYYMKNSKRKKAYQSKRQAGEIDDQCSNNKKKKQTRCGECQIFGHSAAQCKKKIVDLTTGLPEF